jgi:ABC-type transport system involved in cytochrome bd biosynthesis fused ATPase/permease subunit
MRREFVIAPPDLRLVLPLLGISLLAALVGIGFAAREAPWAWLAGIVIVLSGVFIVWTVRRRHVVLDGDLLTIAAGVNTARVRTADLDIAAAHVVNLADNSTLKPGLKTFGTAMPGYQAGHFRLRNRSRAFVLLTDRTKVLALPERNGRMLLLSLEHPQALLDALMTVAEAGARR